MSLETKTAVSRTSSLAIVATDGELLMRFRRHRDEAAFAEVVDRHGRLVWLVCKQALGHRQDVEDAFQATFLILAQRAGTVRASDSAAAWLYRVAQRTAIAARRRRNRRREEPLAAEPPQGEEALPVIHDRQMIYVLMEELQALPERYQTPLVMQYFEGQSRRAIAAQTDSTLAQIQGRLVRGKRMLRSRLIRRGVSLSLATGVVATASTAASAAVTPSFVAATAASSCSFITSGASGGASPAAVELAKQGVRAMWVASITKSAVVVAGVLVVAGALWAAQQGEGVADGAASGAVADGVDLRAVVSDVAAADEPAGEVITVDQNERELDTEIRDDEKNETLKQLRNHIAQISVELQQQREETIAFIAELEEDELEKSLLQRELDYLHGLVMRRKWPTEPVPGADMQEALQKTKHQLLTRTKGAARSRGKIEVRKLQAASLQQRLEDLERIRIQIEYPQLTGEVLRNALPTSEKPSDPTDAAEVLKPGDQIEVTFFSVSPNSPLPQPRARHPFTLDSTGHIQLEQLQPDARPVEVAGVDPRRAEVIIAQSLRMDRDRVRVRWIEPAAASRAAEEPSPTSVARPEPPATPSLTNPALNPGDSIRISAFVVEPEVGTYGIESVFLIEPMGTVALGRKYGRVKVAGLTIPQAEEAIKKHLAEEFKDVVVQVTMEKPIEQNKGELQQMANQLAQMQRALAMLQQENAALKNQLEAQTAPSTTAEQLQLENQRLMELIRTLGEKSVDDVQQRAIIVQQLQGLMKELGASSPAAGTIAAPEAGFGIGGEVPVVGYRAPGPESSIEKSKRNLRQLAIALHTYHDVHKSFPAHASYNADGKPLLSWRVHLLPFLGHEILYREFHFDEPWDSAHNKQLIGRMPDVFRSVDTNGKDNTVYLAPIGSEFIFDGSPEGIPFQRIIDGTSRTIALVEADPDRAVVWTKPEDIEFDPDNPLAGLGGARPEGFVVVFADGRAEVIPKDVDAAAFKALLTKGGQDEPVGLPFLH